MKNNKTLLVSSRGRFVRTPEGYSFQEGDGFYLNEISSLFGNTTIIANEILKSDIQNETFLLNGNIKCVSRTSLFKQEFFKLIKLIKDANIVYVFYPIKSSLLIALLAILFRKKIIAYNGGVWSEMKLLGVRNVYKKKVISTIYNFLEYLSVVFSNVYIVNNNQLYERYYRDYRIIKATPFLRIQKEHVYKRKDTFAKEPVEILCVNHVKEGKKIIEILESFQNLIRFNSVEKYNLTIVGKYDPTLGYAKKVFEYIKDNNLKDKVTFSGIVNDFSRMIKYYRESDMLLLVTESEGFPRVLWEAFSQSLPVICSSLPNIKMEFSDRYTPIYTLESNEPETITKAISELSNDSVLRETLIFNGMKAFRNKTKNTPFEQFQTIIKNIDEG